jgi:hypothetical protein
MHTQPWDAPDDPTPRPTPDDSAGSTPNESTPDDAPPDEELAHLPVQLRNWRVLEDLSARQPPPVEIEGEATMG